MVYSESLAERVQTILNRKKNIVSKKMFGSIAFLLNGNICVGVWKNSLIARVGTRHYATALAEPHVRPFDVTGKAMKGWVLVQPDGVETEAQLKSWINRTIKFVSQLMPK